MLIGIPKEIKNHEYRVGATPDLVQELTKHGHTVYVQTGAGSRIGFSDEIYRLAGATIVPTAEKVYEAEMVIKVKEPLPAEYPLMKKGQILFCFFHLSPQKELVQRLVESQVVAIAFETVADKEGKLPILTPMSEVAGRIAVQVGATALQLSHGGKGLLLGGVPGVAPAKVAVLGGGVVGTQVAKIAMGLGADVIVLDKRLARLRELDDLFGPHLKTLFATPHSIEQTVVKADLVVGAVLIPGAMAPKLVTEATVKKMSPGSVLVDVAIDQGGCSETSRPTSFSDPIYMVDPGIVHYCVTNMPGACARTSTQALTNAVFPYALSLANNGFKKALAMDPGFAEGLNVCLGHVTHKHVAEDTGFPYTPMNLAQ